MSQKTESLVQRTIQKLIRKNGGYVHKTHGNMITEKGLADLRATYKGLSLHWEVKTNTTATDVSPAQGIQCRLAKKAGGITAIISNPLQAESILSRIDYCMEQDYPMKTILEDLDTYYKLRGLDDGTSY